MQTGHEDYCIASCIVAISAVMVTHQCTVDEFACSVTVAGVPFAAVHMPGGLCRGADKGSV